MTAEQLYEELERIVTSLGVEIREESIEEGINSRGGLCTVKGRTLLIINRSIELAAKNNLIMQSLQAFNLEEIYVKPYVRNIIEDYYQRRD
jgi:hypothetical protein